MKRLSCVALMLMVASLAEAHHFKGLPHFSYFENYPQIPQEEFLGQEGQYEFSLVLYDFQGLQRQSVQQPDDARLFLVIYNLRENQVYGGGVLLEVLDGEKVVLKEHREGPEEEMVFQIHGSLPSSGDYALRITLLDGEKMQELIPFELSSQKVGWGKWIAAVLTGLVGVAGVGARRARIARDRTDRARAQRRNG